LKTNSVEQGERLPRRVSFADIGAFQALVGELSKNIKYIEKCLGVNISIKCNTVSIYGDPPSDDVAEKLLKQLYPLVREGYPIHPADIDQGVRLLLQNPQAKLRDLLLDTIFISAGKRPITPKTILQKQYIEAIQTHDIVFGIGPAGTGKTYLAMAMAMASLPRKSSDG
jgi:phosphate starvation-inducible PhoH-like protein